MNSAKKHIVHRGTLQNADGTPPARRRYQPGTTKSGTGTGIGTTTAGG
jgi:hypothetical protein